MSERNGLSGAGFVPGWSDTVLTPNDHFVVGVFDITRWMKD
jgi:hypothetical protein